MKVMKKLLLIMCGLLVATLVNAKNVQIIVKPTEAQASAQIFENGSPISGSNGSFVASIGFLQKKTFTIQADGFETERLLVSYSHQMDVYEVILKPNRKKVNISTNVESASIYVDGEEIGKGNATFNIFKNGEKNIKIVADGYDTYYTSVSFTTSPDLIINRECLLSSNRKDIYVQVNQDGAKVFADGVLVGVVSNRQPVKCTVHKGSPISILIKREGFMDVMGEINFAESHSHYDFGDMPADEAWNATDQNSSDIANNIIAIKVREGMDRNAALKAMKYYITNIFRNLEINDNLAGWVRTTWNLDKFATMLVRTRVELKEIPSDGDGLKFNLLIESQKAAPNAVPTDENFHEWNLILKRYKRMSEDIRNAVN